jgi:hypothetical protein
MKDLMALGWVHGDDDHPNRTCHVTFSSTTVPTEILLLAALEFVTLLRVNPYCTAKAHSHASGEI